jgi:hypothetical protein
MSVESVLEARQIIENRAGMAEDLATRWDDLKGQRDPWEAEKKEIRDYVFATDTSSTSNSRLPWKNSTTIPKLCQIRDNLHANYISAMFPNDNWMKWEAYTQDANELTKRNAIQAYMSNKTRESNFRDTVSKLALDYIDYGIAIADSVWVNENKEDENGEIIPGYVGPMAIRVSPLDVVFDPTAISFEKSWKITRSIKRFGEMLLEEKQKPGSWDADALSVANNNRVASGGFTADDFEKSGAYSIDGFGDLHEYYGSGFVEILEFEGTYHDMSTGELLDDYLITIIDRAHVVRKMPIPAWKRGGHKVMASWRKRPDNLYGMGPLDNLVGMQYRLDHLENLKADILDLTAAPPLKIIGDVDEFDWKPFAEIHVSEGGDVAPLAPSTGVLQIAGEMQVIMSVMEEMAGAPKQAMGIRTPGEKTAFEVQQLENAAGRIFQEKVNQFEIELLEPLLNNMLECAVREMNAPDIIRVMDDDLGVVEFSQITKEDITAKGKLRPVGARHFAQQAQLVQNLTTLANTGVWQMISPHISRKRLGSMVEDLLNIERFDLISDNAGLMDDIDSQRLAQQGQEDLAVEQATPLEGDEEML